MLKCVLYDFDGTLADSFAAITASTNHVRQRYGLSGLSEETVRQYVGLGLNHLMRTLVPNGPEDQTVQEYRSHHATVLKSGTRLLPGVRDTLQQIFARGLKQGVCSNKRVEFTRKLVEDLGLSEFFSVVLGPDDVGHAKPHPAMLLEAVRQLGVTVEETVYVGDMAVDVETARAAGMRVWIVPGGAAGQQSVEAAKPDRMLSRFQEILELI